MIEKIVSKEDRNTIKTCKMTIKDIVEKELAFVIPLYQRLYVWRDEQVIKLLEDIFDAFSNKEEGYFLGSMILSEDKENSFYVIDGQQRLITLWLIGKTLSEILNNEDLNRVLNRFLYRDKEKIKKSRITFAVRDFANRYFENPDIEKMSDEERRHLSNIIDAQSTIKSFFEEKKDNFLIEKFSKYLYRNVYVISTVVPDYADENKLFEVMNNRGEQLKHEDVLKSKLLSFIPENERYFYSIIWDSCSIMDNYIERNIKEISGLKWEDITHKADGEESEASLIEFEELSNKIKSDKKAKREHLVDILESELEILDNKNNSKTDENYETGKVRSIISFPMFLEHVLRVFLYRKGYHEQGKNIEIKETKLLKIFDDFFFSLANEEMVKGFIECLWKIRVKFDKFVIKWVETDNNMEHHMIKRLYYNKKSSSFYRREPETNEGFALLQSMLYHSQQLTTQYWLTPFLHRMLEVDDREELYRYLKKLDNVMFCSEMEGSLRKRSWELMSTKALENRTLKIDVLRKPLGTGFWSYWFYKTDFILWHEFKNNKRRIRRFKEEWVKEEWFNYRITRKNSIEHVSPQNPEKYDSNKVWDENDDNETKRKKLDDFGNLVLITKSLNSSYSNKTFSEKRTIFWERRRLDSLKSALIFRNKSWNWKKCKRHREFIIKLFEKYYKNTMEE